MTDPQRTLTVCYFGTYRHEYSRNKILIEGLRQNGVMVIECHEPLWGSVDERVQLVKKGISLSFIFRAIRAYIRLLQRYFQIRDYDVMVVGYPGQFDVFPAWILTRLKGRPLVWDFFMSIYLISLERNLDQCNRLSVRLLRWIEWIGLRLADFIIQDTSPYKRWLTKTYGISEKKIGLVPTGADNRVFYKRDSIHLPDRFVVLYYGSFIPNHGVPLIIQAAEMLQQYPEILFELIGDGPDRKTCQEMVSRLGLNNVVFLDWMDQEKLAETIARSSICLGAFGDTPQSLMTVHNKVYECMAMGKVVVTGESEAVLDQFSHARDLFTCGRNPIQISQAIRTLLTQPDLCKTIAQNAVETFLNHYALERIGARMLTLIHSELMAEG